MPRYLRSAALNGPRAAGDMFSLAVALICVCSAVYGSVPVSLDGVAEERSGVYVPDDRVRLNEGEVG